MDINSADEGNQNIKQKKQKNSIQKTNNKGRKKERITDHYNEVSMNQNQSMNIQPINHQLFTIPLINLPIPSHSNSMPYVPMNLKNIEKYFGGMPEEDQSNMQSIDRKFQDKNHKKAKIQNLPKQQNVNYSSLFSLPSQKMPFSNTLPITNLIQPSSTMNQCPPAQKQDPLNNQQKINQQKSQLQDGNKVFNQSINQNQHTFQPKLQNNKINHLYQQSPSVLDNLTKNNLIKMLQNLAQISIKFKQSLSQIQGNSIFSKIEVKNAKDLHPTFKMMDQWSKYLRKKIEQLKIQQKLILQKQNLHKYNIIQTIQINKTMMRDLQRQNNRLLQNQSKISMIQQQFQSSIKMFNYYFTASDYKYLSPSNNTIAIASYIASMYAQIKMKLQNMMKMAGQENTRQNDRIIDVNEIYLNLIERIKIVSYQLNLLESKIKSISIKNVYLRYQFPTNQQSCKSPKSSALFLFELLEQNYTIMLRRQQNSILKIRN